MTIRTHSIFEMLVALGGSAIVCTAAWAQTAPGERMRVLFPYFQSNGETGVFLAVSDDGLTFVDANGGRPIFTPPQWDAYEPVQNLTRDPSIVYHDGVFHMVWTSNWEGPVFGYAHSTDLLDWSEPKPVRPFPGAANPRNIWAPEIDYDPVRDEFIVLYSTTLPGEFEDNDGSDDQHGGDHRVFIVRTKDFESFTEPEVLFDPWISTIDADLHYDDRDTDSRDDDRWIMVYKREVGVRRGGKNIRIAYRDPEWKTPWMFVEEPIVGPHTAIRPREVAEGPTLIHDPEVTGGRWLLYWDSYGNGHYSVAGSDDLMSWEDLTDRMHPPRAHPRHGSPFIAPINAVAVAMPDWPPASVRTLSIDPEGPGAAEGWWTNTWAGEAVFAADPGAGRTGGPALRVTSPSIADAGWLRTAYVKPNTRYRLSGWIRTKDLDPGTGMGAVISVRGRERIVTPPITGTTAWTRVEVEFTTGRETSIEFVCLFGGWGSSSGTAWFDDLRLEER